MLPNAPLVQIALGLLAAILALWSIFVEPGVSSGTIWFCLILFYFCLADALLSSVKIAANIRTYIRADVLFLIFYYLIFFLQYQLHVLRIADVSQSRFGFVSQLYPEQSNQAVLLSASGAVAFVLGNLRLKNIRASAESLIQDPLKGIEYAILASQVALIAMYSIAGWQSAGEGRYTGATSGGALADGVSALILMLCMMSAAVLIARSRQRAGLNLGIIFSTLVTIYWCFRLFGSGDRNNLLLILIVYGAGFATYIRQTGRASLFIMLAVGLVMYNSIEAIRMTGDISFGAIWDAAFRDDSTSGPNDVSFNITTVSLRASLAAVPDQIPFGLGLYKIAGALGPIPLIRGYVIGSDWLFATTSDINTYVLLGPHAVWGVGTNVISDIYVDFGPVMVPILMYALGFLSAIYVNSAAKNNKSTGSIVAYLLFLSAFAELPRYAIDFPLRLLVWSFLFVLLYRFCTGSFVFAQTADQKRAAHDFRT